MGPLTFVVCRLLEVGGGNGLGRAEILMWALGPVTLLLLDRSATAFRDRLGLDPTWVRVTTLLGGSVLLKTWAAAAGVMAHLDDVLAMTFAACAVWALAHRRPGLLVAAIACASAAKPWAVMLLPLCLASEFRRPLRTAALGVVAVAAPWLPFVVAHHATFSASSCGQAIDPSSALRALGIGAAQMPHWVRPTQVLLGLVLEAVAVRRGHWPAALLLALAARFALDPSVYGYYTPTLVLAAFVADLLLARRSLPVCTFLTYLGVVVAPWFVSDPAELGRVRLVTTVALALAAVALARGRAADPGRVRMCRFAGGSPQRVPDVSGSARMSRVIA